MKGNDYNHILQAEDVNKKILKEMNDILDALLSDPVLKRPDPKKRFYLRTDASKFGHGNVLLQPGDDKESIEAMERENAGGPCEFDTSSTCKLRLHLIGFSGQKCTETEQFFHSFMNEALAVNVGINKWRIFLWGKTFTLLTDCGALIWLLSYEGTNAAIRRLQFEILGFWFTIWHRPDSANKDTDGISRLGVDFTINPVLEQYYAIAHELKQQYPNVEGEIEASKLPGYRRKTRQKKTKQEIAAHICNVAEIAPGEQQQAGLTHTVKALYSNEATITNIPVMLANIELESTERQTENQFCKCLYQQPLVAQALGLSTFRWIINRFGSGAFFSVCREHNIPFTVPLAIDTDPIGRILLHEFGKAHTILQSNLKLLDRLGEINNFPIQGYFITSPELIDDVAQSKFFGTQVSIIKKLSEKCQLPIFLLHAYESIHIKHLNEFTKKLSSIGWNTSKQYLRYTEFNDAIDSSGWFVIGVNTRMAGPQFESAVQVIPPPPTDCSINAHILEEYNLPRYAIMEISPINDEANVNNGFKTMPLKTAKSQMRNKACIITKVFFEQTDISSASIVGSKVCDTNFPAIPLEEDNLNPFRNLFGIKFQSKQRTFIMSISRFEYASCFNLNREMKRILSQNQEAFMQLARGCPANTMYAMIHQCYNKLLEIRNHSLEVDEDMYAANNHRPSTAPAATVFNVLDGTTIIKLPSKEQWVKAYREDKECQALIAMVNNPGLATKQALETIHYRYRQPLRNRAIKMENDFLVLQETIDEMSFVKLRIVPEKLRNIIFIAFHLNPIGGHFLAYYTMHRVRLRFFWPGMFQYIRRMCKSCAACQLSNSSHQRSKELVYSFPTDAPFKMVVVDIYKAGEITAFDGEKALFILLDHLTGFAVIEEIRELNSTSFAKTMMKTLLQHGFCHTVIVDADSKFKAIFKETMAILKLNVHWASGNNHDSILVERFNKYLNKGLKIFCTERDSTRTYVEGAQLLAYAWNSAPMAETDISRSMVVMGREYSFPIDFISQDQPTFGISANDKRSYAEDLQKRLKACQEVYTLLIEEHRSMHREYINAKRPHPFIFTEGDVVWSRRQIQSNSKKKIVGKLRYKQTGPWKIIKKTHGGSYELEFIDNPKRKEKKHASELALFPKKILPFPLMKGTDHTYSEIHKKLQENPLEEASIKGYKGFDLVQPWQLSNSSISYAKHLSPIFFNVEPFPTVEELNEDCRQEEPNKLSGSTTQLTTSLPNNTRKQVSLNSVVSDQPTNTEELVQPRIQNKQLQRPATATELMTRIIQSEDKLFIIRFQIPNLNRYEWKVVQVDLETSIKENKLALQNGRVLVKFYINHPSDEQFNAPNQRFWTEYHKGDGRRCFSEKYHLVKPSKDEDNYCRKNELQAMKQWINLHDEYIFLLGPFNFATIHGRKTRDRIPLEIWQEIHRSNVKVDNRLPPLECQLQGFVCHIDTPFHSKYDHESIRATVQAHLFQAYFE